MKIGLAIYKMLNDNIAVESLVGTRIAPSVMSQRSPFPFIVYDVANNTPEDQKDSVATLDEYDIMVSGYSKTYTEASVLANYIRTALDRRSGVFYGINIQSVDFEGYDDIFDDDSGMDGIYRKSLNFKVRVLNSFNNIYSTLFDGVDEYVQIDGAVSVISQTKGSVSAWIKLETVSSSCNVFRFQRDTDNLIALLYHAFDNEFRFTFKPDGTANSISFDGSSKEGDGQWHHIAATWNTDAGTTDLKLYFDGVLQVSSSPTTDAFAGAFTSAAIASNSASPAGGFWKGNIDEVGIFTSELSATQIRTIYNDRIPYSLIEAGTTTSDLVGWWRMGDGTLTGDPVATAPTIPDDSSNTNNGTMNNMEQADFKADVSDAKGTA